jgi:hypothetical protein
MLHKLYGDRHVAAIALAAAAGVTYVTTLQEGLAGPPCLPSTVPYFCDNIMLFRMADEPTGQQFPSHPNTRPTYFASVSVPYDVSHLPRRA